MRFGAVIVLAWVTVVACGKEPPPAPSPSDRGPSPPPVGACVNLDVQATCSYALARPIGDAGAGAELRYQVAGSCAYDGGSAMADRVTLVVPRTKAAELEEHYGKRGTAPCTCHIVRPPCAPSVILSPVVEPPPYARVER